MSRLLPWLPGPILGLVLIGLDAGTRPGPGLFFWAAFAGLAFLILAPALQFALLRTARFKERPTAACGAAIAFVACGAVLGLLSGAFNFW